MKILVIGSGGREHAIVWKIGQSNRVKKIFCAPGNGGTSEGAENISIPATEIKELVSFAWEHRIDLTFVGPEVPLVKGIADVFSKKGLLLVGPDQYCARLEGSKRFAKELMQEANIPTASYRLFTHADDAKHYLHTSPMPCVIKADGLAQGKGVFVVQQREEALKAIDAIMVKKIFGSAGDCVIIEECLKGREVSVMVMTDGKTILPLAPAQDYKRAFDEDQGPNTGGMGAYSPAETLSPEMLQSVIETCVRPMIHCLSRKGMRYQGILYAGLMLTEKGPKVLEYNVRLGDPETQVILPRLTTDIVEVATHICEGTLEKCTLAWKDNACVTVALCSGGYPGEYVQGKIITGLSVGKDKDDRMIFHAGTKREKRALDREASYMTAGGRVLNVTSLGATLKDARQKVYAMIPSIQFEGMHYRNDIAGK